MKPIKKQKNFGLLFLINIAIVVTVFVSLFYLEKYETVTVDTVALNIRTGPGLTYDIQTQAKKGAKLTIMAEKNQWYKVRMADHSTGWVAGWLVTKGNTSASTNVSATVNTDQTKLRESGSTESSIVERLAKGTKVTITLEQNGWAQVEVNQKTGWIHSSLLDISNKKTTKSKNQTLFARQDNTKIRKSASVSSDIIETLDYGDSVQYISEEQDWYKVKTSEGKTGYIANWVVSTEDLNKSKQKLPTTIAEATIVLDAGHGGSDPGAESNDGLTKEKYVTLATVKKVKKELEKVGANVILTRSDDRLVPLAQIAKISNKAKADAFISFHFDSSNHANQASGTTTYYQHKRDKALAKTINDQIATLTLENRGYETADYQVLRDNHQPAVLLELGYINNDYDAREIQSSIYQTRIAHAVVEGLSNYFSGQ